MLLFIVSFIRQSNKWDLIFSTSMYLILYGYGFIGLLYDLRISVSIILVL